MHRYDVCTTRGTSRCQRQNQIARDLDTVIVAITLAAIN